MDRRLIKAAITLAAVLFSLPAKAAPAAAPAEGQIPDPVSMRLPGAAKPGTDPLQLMQNGQVQKDLGLSASQVERLRQLNDQTRALVRSVARTRGGGAGAAPSVGAVRGYEAQQQQAQQDARQKVAEILQPNQLQQFRMIVESQPGADPMELLQSDQVRSALGLSQDQAGQLRQLAGQLRAGGRTRGTSPGSQELAAQRTRLDQQVREARQQVADILTAQQLQRLKQILVQVDVAALADPALVSTLGLTPVQQRQLATSQAEGLEAIGTSFKPVRTRSGDPLAQCAGVKTNRTSLDPLLHQSRQRTRGVLTAEQLATLKQLEGEPIRLDPPACAP
ncbi:MAG: hypothetical protein KME02_03840 [Aphanothece saxicola GSE-SYN-MK-01-06B]|jgi:Spy/CpxP family protein refolding chaperone|nr:hypothetical protein [Aphanothece saxicola GSE-SYN-MK-01-06B]